MVALVLGFLESSSSLVKVIAGIAFAVLGLGSAPAFAQFQQFGTDWQQPSRSRSIDSQPTRDNIIYRQSPPLNGPQNFDSNRTRSAPSRGFAQSSGSYFGW